MITSVITNLVVALMIVTNTTEETAWYDEQDAVSKFVDSQFVVFDKQSKKLNVTKHTTTNFVYSTDIDMRMRHTCDKCGKSKLKTFTPSDFIGKPIYEIWFKGMPDIICEGCVEKIIKRDRPECEYWHSIINMWCKLPDMNDVKCPVCNKVFHYNSGNNTVYSCEKTY